MKSEENTLRFFLGANTPQGFVSRFDQLADGDSGWRVMVIKGGPGCGKSTMMKKVAEGLQEEGCSGLEVIHCSSDVDSVDGVVVPALRYAIVDGTPPHALEPRYPGALESIVDITACWDGEQLYSERERIIDLSRSCSRCHEHCCRFLSAAGALIGDTYRIALEQVNTAKLSAYCGRLTDREFKAQRRERGTETVRFLSALTNKGTVSFVETAEAVCDRIYLINDDLGAVSRLLLHSIRSKALAAGYDIISCYCPLSPYDKLEQILVPELRLGFITSNRFHDFSERVDPYRIVNCMRFSDADGLRASKKRISFNRKSATQMLGQAEALLRDAKSLHDELESYYIHAMDFEKLDHLTENVLAQAVSLAAQNR